MILSSQGFSASQGVPSQGVPSQGVPSQGVATANARMDVSEDGVRHYALRPLASGTEVVHAYPDHLSSVEFLMNYGMFQTHNPNDKVGVWCCKGNTTKALTEPREAAFRALRLRQWKRYAVNGTAPMRLLAAMRLHVAYADEYDGAANDRVCYPFTTPVALCLRCKSFLIGLFTGAFWWSTSSGYCRQSR